MDSLRVPCELCDAPAGECGLRVNGELLHVCERCWHDLRKAATNEQLRDTPLTRATRREALFLAVWMIPASIAVLHYGLDIGMPFSLIFGLLLQSFFLDVWGTRARTGR